MAICVENLDPDEKFEDQKSKEDAIYQSILAIMYLCMTMLFPQVRD